MANKRLQVKNSRSTDGDLLWKTLDESQSTYWSGLDARIYANDILIDEIIGLNYQLQESVAPLFSYASYTYDAIMHGARRVQGTFSINFKRDGYIFEVLRNLATPAPQPEITRLQQTEPFRIALAGGATVDDFMALAAGGVAVKYSQDRNGNAKPRIDYSIVREIAEDFQRALWGVEPDRPTDKRGQKVRELAKELVNEASLEESRFELAKRFDLYIVFGSVPPEDLRIRRIVGGSSEALQNPIPVSTTTRIKEVALTGVEKMVDDSGRNVVENYSFIARDIV